VDRSFVRTARSRITKPAAARAVGWVALIAVAWFAGKFGEEFNLPAPHVILSVVIGLVVASTGLMRRTVPKHLHTAAQAVTGIIIGTFLNVHALATAGGSLLPLLAVTAATLILSLAGGLLLARWTGLDQTTASLGMVAGGSAAIVGAAEDLGADARMVAFMQYLRLALVVLTMPALVALVFAPGAGHLQGLGAQEIEVPFSIGGWLFLLWAAPAGYLLGKLLRLPAPALLGPVLLAAIVTIAGIGVDPPEVAREIAFNIIGLEVGLRLTPAALRAMGRMLPKVMLFVLLITGSCAALAYVVTLTTAISPANAYLATTPGGINAVLALASSVDANVALVFAVQTLRLFAMVLLAPVALRWWLGRRAATAMPTPPEPGTDAPHPVAELAPTETD
jgi:membrane AbrB-like protein